MVGTALVESTVKNVIPALQTNSVQLKKVIESLTDQLRKTHEELSKWRTKYNVQVVVSS